MKRVEIRFAKDDRIAVIAPHPDDESLGASAPLLLAPDRTDIYVMTDGSHGSKDRSPKEEAVVRRRQFEAEMSVVRPGSFEWLGYEDSRLSDYPEAADEIDFRQYTRIFLPWTEDDHPDHRAAAQICLRAIRLQQAKAECYSYEISRPFPEPTHYVDITDLEEKKRRLIRFHEDQKGHEQITLLLNAFRGAQMRDHKKIIYAECYLRVDPYEEG